MMDLLKSLKNFLYNHRRKFVISGIAVGSAVAAFNYVRYQIQKQEKLDANEFLETIRRQRYFGKLETSCHRTIINLGDLLDKEITNLLGIESIVSQLKSKPENSLELWKDLKIKTFAEVVIVVYAQVILVLLFKVQFSVIGGYQYKYQERTPEKISQDMKTEYLSLYVNFFKTGLPQLYHFVIDLMQNFDIFTQSRYQKRWLDYKLKSHDFTEIMDGCLHFAIVNFNFSESISNYLDIENHIKNTREPVLKEIYSETADILSSKELITDCCYSLLANITELANTQLTEAFNSSAAQGNSQLFFAKTLPVIHKTIKMNNKIWLKHLTTSDKLQTLAANIYESFC